MNNRKILSLALVCLIALPQLSFAQAAANCEAVTKAAQAGRDNANMALANNQLKLKENAQFARNCMEIFGDLASMQIMVIGGFDISPLRDMLLEEACSIIKDEVIAALPMTNVPPPWNGIAQEVYRPVRLGSSGGGNSGGSSIFGGGNGSSPINFGGSGSGPSMPSTPSMPSMGRSSSTSTSSNAQSGSADSSGSVWDRMSRMISGNR